MELSIGQRRAVEARTRGLLVSAAAGSGKTKVLVERLMGYIQDEKDPIDIDRFLIITFTKAAAGEMRARIVARIGEELERDPHSRLLRRQIARAHEADISTVHAFCGKLLRAHSAEAGLSPDFRVGSEEECLELQSRALEQVLEARYEAASPAMLRLADALASEKSDDALAGTVINIYERLRAIPARKKWIAAQSTQDGALKRRREVWRNELARHIESRLGHHEKAMSGASGEMRGDERMLEAYGEEFSANLGALQNALSAARDGWSALKAALESCEFPKLRTLSKYGDAEKAERVKAVRQNWKKAHAKLCELVSGTREEHEQDIRESSVMLTELLDIVEELDRGYSEAKRKLGVCDFSDLEEMAVSLLCDGGGEPTDLARSISASFTEVMVDEYQDISPMQDMIIAALSSECRRFLVGDVKQSIYRFRGADPSIFLEKYNSWPEYTDDAQENAKVLLSRNYRSRAEILEATNRVFGAIMSAEVGEMDYTEAEKLVYSRNTPDDPGPVEFLIAEPDANPEPEDAESGELETPKLIETEANMVAGRIKELIDSGFQIGSGDAKRPVGPGDFCIILRSLSGRVRYFDEALSRRGLDCAGAEGDFFETMEIAVLLSLLQIIDNPRQDIPLVSVLRSPIYGFEDEYLARIRCACKSGGFYDALSARAESGDARAAGFLDDLDGFRRESASLGSDRLIRLIFDKTGMPGLYGAMSGGVRRRANLLWLYELARDFEKTSFRGLFEFNQFARSRLGRFGSAPPRDAAVDAVRITTIHRSKGLQYPVVVLANLAKRFNTEDLRSPVLTHAELGMCMRMRDSARMIQYKTMARQAMEARLRFEQTAEEMRMLYVGMTRAVDKLIMTCALNSVDRRIHRLMELTVDGGVTPYAVDACGSMADWILLALQTDGSDIPACETRFVPASRCAPEAGSADGEETLPTAGPGLVRELERRVLYKYPYAYAANLPSKLTATSLYRETREPETRTRRPVFADAPGLDPMSRGTAVHAFMQHCDLSRCTDVPGVEGELERLAREGVLSGLQAGAVDPRRISAFLNSGLGVRLLASSDVRREQKFSLLIPAGYLYDAPGGDEILLQGVVDCCFDEPDGLVVLDFKTDRLRPGDEIERAVGYEPQLMAYRLAMKRVLGRPVKQCAICFLHTGYIHYC